MQATHAQGHASHPRKLHPIMWAAAISVIVLSIVGVGAITGLIPTSNGQSASEKAIAPLAGLQPGGQPAAPAGNAHGMPGDEKVIVEYEQPAAKPEVAQTAKPVPAKPAARPAPHRESSAKPKPVATHAAKPAPVRADQVPNEPVQVAAVEQPPAAPPAVCHECGVVSSVRAIEQKGEGTGVGAVGGAVAGGVLGRQVGGGRGRDVMTVIGAIAGGLGGHEIEKNVRKVVKHEVSVRFEDGSTRSFTYDKTPMFRSGDHVRLSQGELAIDNR